MSFGVFRTENNRSGSMSRWSDDWLGYNLDQQKFQLKKEGKMSFEVFRTEKNCPGSILGCVDDWLGFNLNQQKFCSRLYPEHESNCLGLNPRQ